MRIAIIGTGYVGLVTGSCLAEVGHHVVCIDNDERKIKGLRSGKIHSHPIGILVKAQKKVVGMVL